MERIQYSAVVLDDKSKHRLLKKLQNVIPEDWEKHADHMTINVGEIDPEFERYLGMAVKLNVEKIGIDDKVIAVTASGFPTKSEKPHITIAVNTKMGGRPSMAKNLTNWELMKRPFPVFGKVTEIEFK